MFFEVRKEFALNRLDSESSLSLQQVHMKKNTISDIFNQCCLWLNLLLYLPTFIFLYLSHHCMNWEKYWIYAFLSFFFFFVLRFSTSLFPSLPPCLPPGRPTCQRWLQESRLWEQPVSLTRSPAPQAEGQPSIPAYMNPLVSPPCPCNPHTCSPIIRGSNFISTRVAAHCRQPLQSFLINSRFVPYPSFWTHLSSIPIGASLCTPRQPSDPNPTKNPTPPSFQETLSIFFFPTCRSPTYGVR